VTNTIIVTTVQMIAVVAGFLGMRLEFPAFIRTPDFPTESLCLSGSAWRNRALISAGACGPPVQKKTHATLGAGIGATVVAVECFYEGTTVPGEPNSSKHYEGARSSNTLSPATLFRSSLQRACLRQRTG